MRGVWWLHVHGIRRRYYGGVRGDGLGGLCCRVVDIPCGRVDESFELRGCGFVHIHCGSDRDHGVM